MTHCRVAAVQAAPVWMDTAATVARACELIEEAAAGGAQLVALPEVFVPGYPYWNWIMSPIDGSRWFRTLAEQAIVVPGPETERLCQQARRAGVHVVIGVNERSAVSAGTLYNTNLVIGPDGELLDRHRKLVPTWAEKLTWAGGDGSTLRVHDTAIGRLGTLACGENTNTLARFALLAQGEQIHVANYPAFPFANFDMPQGIGIRAGAHSFEGKLHTVVACSVLTDEIVDAVCATPEQRERMSRQPNAYSAVYGPDGCVIEELLQEPGIVYADIDLDRGLEMKQFHDIVGHYNRFDIFSLTVRSDAAEPLQLTGEPHEDAAAEGAEGA